MAKLSLTARKNIQTYEFKLQENLKAIETASGILFEVDFDWLAVAPFAEAAGYSDRIGETLYCWYLGGLAENIETFCSDPMQKEAFVETFGTAKRISFEFFEPGDDVRTRNDNGTLMMGSPKTMFCSYASQCGADLAKVCSGDDVLGLVIRKNIRDSQHSRDANLERLKTAVGIPFELEVDWIPLAKAIKGEQYEERLGEVIHAWHLNGLADNLEKLCQDDLSKEAVAEACSKKKISFVLDTTGKIEEAACAFVDGVLTITLPQKFYNHGGSGVGSEIESLL